MGTAGQASTPLCTPHLISDCRIPIYPGHNTRPESLIALRCNFLMQWLCSAWYIMGQAYAVAWCLQSSLQTARTQLQTRSCHPIATCPWGYHQNDRTRFGEDSVAQEAERSGASDALVWEVDECARNPLPPTALGSFPRHTQGFYSTNCFYATRLCTLCAVQLSAHRAAASWC